MNKNAQQGELLGLIWRPFWHPFRLRVNDVLRINGRIGRVIRVTECAAVVLVNQPARHFTTRFDKEVSFRAPPVTIRIAANSETEILNRKQLKKCKGGSAQSALAKSRGPERRAA